jgi:hypothetical protein
MFPIAAAGRALRWGGERLLATLLSKAAKVSDQSLPTEGGSGLQINTNALVTSGAKQDSVGSSGLQPH